jgi:hypothetical protein
MCAFLAIYGETQNEHVALIPIAGSDQAGCTSHSSCTYWLPFVLRPALAMLTTPGACSTCSSTAQTHKRSTARDTQAHAPVHYRSIVDVNINPGCRCCLCRESRTCTNAAVAFRDSYCLGIY